MKLTAKRLRYLFNYDPETGVFTRRINLGRWGELKAGTVAGSLHLTLGSRAIHIGGKLYYEHRLAWLYMTGKWPELHIDHINQNPSDNRWKNLREATHGQNLTNRKHPAYSHSKLRGVELKIGRRTNKWTVRPKIDGKRTFIANFANKLDAAICSNYHAAYSGDWRPLNKIPGNKYIHD